MSQQNRQSPESKRVRLLLVEDDLVDRELLRRALERSRLDCEVIEVGTASAARRAFRAAPFDCVLLDLSLPDDDGLTLVQALGQTPTIILTGLGDARTAEKALQHGAQDYLLKGEIDGRSLSRAVRYAIERKHGELLRTKLHHTERLASLGGLAASVAHEVNNPASFVMANLLSMREGIGHLVKALEDLSMLGRQGIVPASVMNLVAEHLGPTASIAEMLDDSLEGMHRITSIVRQMQTFSRSEDATEPVTPVSLNKVAQWACLLAGPQIRHRARLEQDLEPQLPMLPGHQARLGQVVTNLLVNAAQAIPAGRPDDHVVRITTRTHYDEIELHVEDSGPGIPDALRARVLEPFFTTKPVGEGTGLGLSVSADIVRSHRGELLLENREEGGTRAILRFPRNTGLVPTLPHPSVPPVDSIRRLRVLLVDDEPAVTRAYRRLLRDHDVVIANATDALKELERNSRFDAVLCDIMMPDIDGPAFYEILKQRFPHLPDRVVFLTGGVFTDRVQDFVDSVQNRVLSKPVSRERLLEALLRAGSSPPPATAPRPEPRLH